MLLTRSNCCPALTTYKWIQYMRENLEKKVALTFSLYIFLSLPASSSIGWSSFWSNTHILPLVLSFSSSISTLEAIWNSVQMILQLSPPTLSDIPFPQSLTPRTRTQLKTFKPNQSEITERTETWNLNFDLHLKSMSNPTKNCTTNTNLKKNENWKLN